MTRPRFGFALGNSNVHAPPLEPLSKRGGSGSAALTNTQDPSLFPTSPPESTYKSGVPKIGGSEGGFIGLIVGLAVLIILCSCAVFYLLRTRPHGGRSGNKNHPSPTSAPTGLFASRRKRNAGWVQQSDEFDYDSAEDEDLVSKRGAGPPVRYGDGGSGYTGQPLQDTERKMGPSAAASASAADAYTDPFDPEQLPESVRRQQAPLRTQVPEKDRRSYSSAGGTPKQSPTTPTFEGGTKFREQF